MPLEDFIITVFCWIEEHWSPVMGGQRLRQRGFAPKLTDSEVIMMEVVGEFLGLETDVGLWTRALNVVQNFQGVAASLADWRCASRRATDT